jgi:hypothetical protein
VLLSGWVRPVSPVYSSPKSGSAAAATTPARLAKEFDGHVLWRTTSDGTTYVVALRKGNLERYRVNDDGTTTRVDSSPRRLGRRWLVALFVVGGLLFVGAGIASESHPELTPLVVVGWLLWAAGIVIGGLGQDLPRRAHRAYGGKGQWHAPTDLWAWTPQSAAQLSAVERIADEHAGVAYVRDVGARSVDVVGVRKGRIERYWVDEHGDAGLLEVTDSRGSYLAERILRYTFLALWLGLTAVLLAVEERKGLLIALIVGALAVVMLAAWRSDPEGRLMRRLKSGADDWIEIRTQEPENDA